MSCTPFYYAAEPATIVALIPDPDGVRVNADQQLPDNSWIDVCDLRFSWNEFTEFAQCISEIAADPRAAIAKITDDWGRSVHPAMPSGKEDRST